MAKNKRKEKKKLARAKIAKARVLSRRKKIKETNSLEKKQARYAHKFREKLQPIINDPEKKKAMEESKEKALKEKLEQNAEMLKYLEEQYETEMKNKADVNKELEEQGHITFQEKLAALEKQVIDKMETDAKDSGIEDIVDAAKKVQLLNDPEAADSVESITLEEPKED